MAQEGAFVLPAEVKSFRDYFNLRATQAQIAEGLGYEFTPGELVLPRSARAPAWADDLAQFLGEVRALAVLNAESSRREALIAPIMLNLLVRERLRVEFEYPIEINAQLRGSLDYLVRSKTNLLVVEAKRGETGKGMQQIVAQLIAVDLWTKSDASHLYAALSLGTSWEFVVLDRAAKRITQDNRSFAVPDHLPDLLRVILGILSNGAAHDTAI